MPDDHSQYRLNVHKALVAVLFVFQILVFLSPKISVKPAEVENVPRGLLTGANLVSMKPLVFLTLGTYLLVIGLVVSKILPGIRFPGKGATTFLITCATCLAIFGFMLSIQIYQVETNTEAIVLQPKVDVKSAPDEAGTDVFTLHQGVKVGIVDRSLSWIKIRLADGKVGWMRQQGIEVI